MTLYGVFKGFSLFTETLFSLLSISPPTLPFHLWTQLSSAMIPSPLLIHLLIFSTYTPYTYTRQQKKKHKKKSNLVSLLSLPLSLDEGLLFIHPHRWPPEVATATGCTHTVAPGENPRWEKKWEWDAERWERARDEGLTEESGEKEMERFFKKIQKGERKKEHIWLQKRVKWASHSNAGNQILNIQLLCQCLACRCAICLKLLNN